MADKGAVGVKNDGTNGPQPVLAGRATVGVPIDLVITVVSTYGQTGGGIAIFGG